MVAAAVNQVHDGQTLSSLDARFLFASRWIAAIVDILLLKETVLVNPESIDPDCSHVVENAIENIISRPRWFKFRAVPLLDQVCTCCLLLVL
jgi:hypothetical protein